ncbi:hypothetical protein PCANC_13854 [Puccinia coronata f. sp. avenae]|uniref:Amino-acid acetyltransferase, mitochondrial n=1 Tax=Puccinia coronata f. sp. avenae TaxID=200324 RepID=A0A2N5UT80_9BASI|nr:hypothetical protein PCASD_06171 [Puccinia coronata f. sp. avenae]PLW40944.1 hypothetical protein PCANC_13854 [Puccinia coronata f. sp. avenae]
MEAKGKDTYSLPLTSEDIYDFCYWAVSREGNKGPQDVSTKTLEKYLHTRNIGLATLTLIRKRFPIKVIRGMENLDWNKLKDLLEKLFKKTLDHENYFARLEESLRFVILAGYYQAAAIVTDEKEQNNEA